jgi:hypothetical protein
LDGNYKKKVKKKIGLESCNRTTLKNHDFYWGFMTRILYGNTRNQKRFENYTNLCCRNRKTSNTGSISTQERFRTQNISKNSSVLNTN